MDVKVITRHGPSSYGSLLQAMATIKVLKGLGHQARLVNYVRPDERGLRAVLTSLAGKPSWNGNLLKKMVYIGVRYPEEKWAEMKFDRMRRYYLNMTKRCTSVTDLGRLKADVFMTGSDQVWGPMMNGKPDGAYFLDFVKQGKKVAYAASFGRTEFMPQVLFEYKKLLGCYDRIAVRENSAVKLLEEMNIACVGQVLDPTLLLTGEEWSQYIKKDVKGKYVLVYQLHNNPMLCRYAQHFANKVKLPLLRISPSFHQFRCGGKFVYLPDIDEFLSYIKNSTYFITDSFHGTAFAINFNRQFIEILPNNKTDSRNQSILQLTGLTERIVTDYENFFIANKTIDYKTVNEILDKERRKSMKILKTLLGD